MRSTAASRANAVSVPAALSATLAPKAATTSATIAVVVASSAEMPTVSASMARRLMPLASAAAMMSAALPGTDTVTVSKNEVCSTSKPAALSEAAMVRAWPWVVSAIAFSPSGPW